MKITRITIEPNGTYSALRHYCTQRYKNPTTTVKHVVDWYEELKRKNNFKESVGELINIDALTLLANSTLGVPGTSPLITFIPGNLYTYLVLNGIIVPYYEWVVFEDRGYFYDDDMHVLYWKEPGEFKDDPFVYKSLEKGNSWLESMEIKKVVERLDKKYAG